MKQVVSISLGSSRRDHEVTTILLGEPVRIRRIGVDGDFSRARQLFREMDGRVDAFGIGGCEFGINFDGRYYPLRSVAPLVEGLSSPVVDGSGVRGVVERGMGKLLNERLGDRIAAAPRGKRVLFCVSAGRYDLVEGFAEAGFQLRFGDPGFVVGLPYASTNFWLAKQVGHWVIPLVVKAPFRWLYPTGKSQERNRPRFRAWFDWATVIADDFHYIRRHLPEAVPGKIIVTNTTTEEDRELLRQRGAAWLVTSTPVLDGRSFGTNVFEAALTAVSGLGRKLQPAELAAAIKDSGFSPHFQQLN